MDTYSRVSSRGGGGSAPLWPCQPLSPGSILVQPQSSWLTEASSREPHHTAVSLYPPLSSLRDPDPAAVPTPEVGVVLLTAHSPTPQVIASHHMQSISFASGGDTVRPGRAGWPSASGPPPSLDPRPVPLSLGVQDPGWGWVGLADVSLPPCPQDMTDYVAYVAKDPINQRGEARGGAVWAGAGPAGAASLVLLVTGSSLSHPGVL